MSNLFIIGNGFDLAHGLKTNYLDFREYLIELCPNLTEEKVIYEEKVADMDYNYTRDGIKELSEESVISIFRNLVYTAKKDNQNPEKILEGKDNWNNLEKTLGEIDLEDYFYRYSEIVYDKEKDPDLFKTAYNNEVLAADIFNVFPKVMEFFKKWVCSIEIDKEKVTKMEKFNDLIFGEDLFLTFNYTPTLEKIYDINPINICYIHGRRDSSNLLFGHGNSRNYYDEYQQRYIGSENYISELFEFLKKDTAKALNDNIDFFNRLSNNINKIYSFGFSFSDIDKIYIKKICARCRNKNITWYLLEKDRYKHFDKNIKSCGFVGNFDYYDL